MWVNAKGERFWVKYHFKTDQGIECLAQDEADRIAGEDATTTDGTSSRRSRATIPSWTLEVQIMPFEDAKSYRFNPFDLDELAAQRLPADRGWQAGDRLQTQ